MRHGTVFNESEEREIILYLNDCCILGMSRTSDEFQRDLKVYYELKTKDDSDAKKYVFGSSWFNRFKEENGLEFPTNSEADDECKKFKEMRKWNEETMQYIRRCNGNELIPSAHNIFVIECEYLSLEKDESVPQNEQRTVSFLVAYNAVGHVMKPIIIRDSTISFETRQKYGEVFLFETTEKNEVKQSSLLFLNMEIKRYVDSNKLEGPLLFYLTPHASKSFGFVFWGFCRQHNVIAQFIPSSLFYWFKVGNHGMFEMIQREWRSKKAEVYLEQEEALSYLDFYRHLKKVWTNLHIKGQLEKTCREFKLRPVQRKVRQRKRRHDDTSKNPHEQVEEDGASNYKRPFIQDASAHMDSPFQAACSTVQQPHLVRTLPDEQNISTCEHPLVQASSSSTAPNTDSADSSTVKKRLIKTRVIREYNTVLKIEYDAIIGGTGPKSGRNIHTQTSDKYIVEHLTKLCKQVMADWEKKCAGNKSAQEELLKNVIKEEPSS